MAAFRDILVYLHPEAVESSVIGNAVGFAASRNAHLTALYVVDIPEIPSYVKAELPREVLKNQRKLYQQQAEAAKSALDAACGAAGVSSDWRCVEDDAAAAVIQHGRYFDVVLMEGAAGEAAPAGERMADRVILECGRPVLVLPARPVADTLGSRITLAWNARKESVRALHDALPLLQGAEWVKVVSVNPEIGDQAHGQIPGVDVGKHLARHGINAEAHSVSADARHVGESLLTWAEDEQSDLLILGAYGRARWSEMVLGGVTAYVLSHAALLPVLMSH